MWVLAAAGLKSPDELRPELLNRRVSLTEIRNYRELYPYLEAGDLLDGKAPQNYMQPWLAARSDSFN